MKRQPKPDVPRSKVSLSFSEPDTQEIGIYCFSVPISCLSALKEQAVAYGGQLDPTIVDPLLYRFLGENSHLTVITLALLYMFL